MVELLVVVWLIIQIMPFVFAALAVIALIAFTIALYTHHKWKNRNKNDTGK